MYNVSIVGAGAMGTALAMCFEASGNSVTLCATEFDEAFVEAIERNRMHPSLGRALADRVGVVRPDGWGPVIEQADLLVLAVSSVGIRGTMSTVAKFLRPDRIILVATKGWDPDAIEPLSELLGREAPNHPLALFVGPTLAGELASGRPTAAVCASESLAVAKEVAEALQSPTLRIFCTDDVVGVEVGAALKNVIAVAIGMCQGLEETGAITMTNAKAALFSQGLIEMTQVVHALGGREESVLGLAGAGDLFVTVMGGRNGQFGRLVGLGTEPEAALAEMATTVEGYEGTTRAVRLAQRLGLDLPLVRMVHNVLYDGRPAPDALASFFADWSGAA